MNLTDETQTITDFVPFCELDLQDERGDHADDWSGLDQRYALIGGFLLTSLRLLQERLPLSRIHFPPFTPDHNALDYVHHWREAAELADVLQIHAYDSLVNIQRQYDAYRAAFPSKAIMVSEWHCKGDIEEERRVLQWFADLAERDSLFFGATFFIWRWWDHPGWWSDAWDIEHSPDRLALFMDPPTVTRVPEPQEPTMPDLPFGIDVSNNNGGIDWARVAGAGVQFAIAKVSEGAHFRDGYFAENWQAMKAHGIIRGAYHYALPSQYGPVQEARYFVDAIGLLGQTLEPGDLLALDLEDPAAGGDLSGWTLTFLQEVERLAGFKPLVYTSPGYVQAHGLANRPEIGDYGLWCASWGVPTPPQAPAPWDLVAIHQYAVGGPGSVPGVAGECDLNRYNGPIDTLPLYGKLGVVEPPVPPAPAYSVGEGILAAMAANGDTPATDEQFISPQWSEAYGRSGARYVWVGSLGRVIRYDPAA